jgi:hypothetical protein
MILCAWCGCREGTEEIDGQHVCPECLADLEMSERRE